MLRWLSDAAVRPAAYLVRRLVDPPPDYACYQLTRQTAMPSTQQSLDLFTPYLNALRSAG